MNTINKKLVMLMILFAGASCVYSVDWNKIVDEEQFYRFNVKNKIVDEEQFYRFNVKNKIVDEEQVCSSDVVKPDASMQWHGVHRSEESYIAALRWLPLGGPVGGPVRLYDPKDFARADRIYKKAFGRFSVFFPKQTLVFEQNGEIKGLCDFVS